MEKRSNITETSIVKLGNDNDDNSSMNSGLSGSNFSYLKSYSHNMKSQHRRVSKLNNSSVASSRKNLNQIPGALSSEAMSQG